MGIGPGQRSSYKNGPSIVETFKGKFPNPDKKNFKILHIYQNRKNDACVVVIEYPDCTNYEGQKVLVYDDIDQFTSLLSKGEVDPHFDNYSYSPVARFMPTDEGIEMAIQFAKTL